MSNNNNYSHTILLGEGERASDCACVKNDYFAIFVFIYLMSFANGKTIADVHDSSCWYNNIWTKRRREKQQNLSRRPTGVPISVAFLQFNAVAVVVLFTHTQSQIYFSISIMANIKLYRKQLYTQNWDTTTTNWSHRTNNKTDMHDSQANCFCAIICLMIDLIDLI